MKRWLRLALALTAAFGVSSAALATNFLSARGTFRTSFSRGFEYDPSDGCYKPSRPYTDDEYAWRSYRSEAERYLDCLQSNADADLRYAQAEIQDGYEQAVDDFLREVRRGY